MITAIEHAQLIEELRDKANNAYYDFLAKMRRDDCFGAPYKMEHGTFTIDNLKAFQEAYTLYGKHLAYNDAIKALWRQP